MISTTYEWILNGISVFALSTQGYVIYVILRHSPLTMRDYKYFLLTFIGWDAAFTFLISIVLQPFPITPLIGGSARGVSRYFGEKSCRFLTACTIYFGSNLIIAQDYCLVYRVVLLRMSKEKHDAYVSRSWKIFWFLFHQSIALPLAIGFYGTFLNSEDIPTYLNKSCPKTNCNVQVGDPIVIIDFYHSYTLNYSITLVCLMVVSEVLCLICIYLILSGLRKHAAKLSRQTYKLQFSLSILLAVQLVIPILFILMPIAIAIVAFYFKKTSSDAITQLGFSILAVYGPVNAILTIVLIDPYRNFTIRLFVVSWAKTKAACLLKNFGTSVIIPNTNRNLLPHSLNGIVLARRNTLFTTHL